MNTFDTIMAQCDETGDYGPVIRAALGARFEAGEGHYCECETPSLRGDALMCGNCLLENRGQVAKREKHMREPHKFRPRPDLPIMCEVCAGWEDDAKHQLGKVQL